LVLLSPGRDRFGTFQPLEFASIHAAWKRRDAHNPGCTECAVLLRGIGKRLWLGTRLLAVLMVVSQA